MDVQPSFLDDFDIHVYDFDIHNFEEIADKNDDDVDDDDDGDDDDGVDDDDGDDIPFDEKEWLVTDPVTKNIRRPHLFEFLLMILANPRYISLISWLNINNGSFRIHKPNPVIRLWEMVKVRQTNSPMNFGGFSRSIRCYYKSGLMIATYKKFTFRFASIGQ